MSLVLCLNLLRNNIRSSCPVRFLKQHAGFSSGKLLQPGTYEKRHFTTKLTDTASWHKTELGSCSPAIPPLWLQQTSGHDHPATVLVFDIETTEANNITTELVCRSDVPRFGDILPILLAYVQSRQSPGKPVLWIAHNAKLFDIPFVMQEFERCSAQVPADWLFVDSLCLARKLKKLDENIGLVNLKALGKHYKISSKGPSHRAMPDVQVLCDIFQNITLDLKLTRDDLMNEASIFYDFRKVSRK
ncbi:unnamed protein product [Urochloa decumbens]|uniref:Exonuclease domain-containing protein n=1 Tax=Urochloa decumbens TaxID=240449 RepID=A0ABC9C5A3_9POAL